MKEAWKTEVYRKAAKIRESIMRETAVGVHVGSVDEKVVIMTRRHFFRLPCSEEIHGT